MPNPMSRKRHFTPATFKFLKDLKANNDRDWFAANQERYESELRGPALEFIRDFAEPLFDISPYFRADDRKAGGSLFRIHRDIRFSADKSPYKTYTGIHFRHERGKDAHCPGFYLHIEPRQVFAGVGIWHPDGETLGLARQAIVDAPDAWERAVGDPAFRAEFELAGETLKRAPRGFDPEHPLVDDLKRKDFIGVKRLTQKELASGGFVHRYAEICRAGSSLVEFLCRAVDVPF